MTSIQRPGTFRRAAAALLATLLAVPVVAGVLPRARATATFVFTRLAGDDRYGTAAAIATATFPVADTVVLARGDQYADALAGAFLAGQLGAPTLLTKADSVPQPTLDAMKALETKNVVILGGTQAVSQGVEDDLKETPSTA
jgi:putative cell wall-binding protein